MISSMARPMAIEVSTLSWTGTCNLWTPLTIQTENVRLVLSGASPHSRTEGP